MSKIVKNKKPIFCLIIAGILMANAATLAAFQVEWPNSPVGTPLNATSELQDLIKYFYEWAIALGGLAIFIVLVFAGFQYLTSTGNPASMSEAQERIRSAVIGLVLLLGSVLILNTINPELTTFRPLVFPEPGELLGDCEFYYEVDPETGEKKEPPIRREDPQQYCKENFGDDYECKNNICAIDLTSLFSIKNCGGVDIIVEGTPHPIALDGYEPVSIGEGVKFEIIGSPDKCMGVLTLSTQYSAGLFGTGLFAGKCKGDKRTIYLNESVINYGRPDDQPRLLSVDINVACAQLAKIQ
jgi:hypothetical protein